MSFAWGTLSIQEYTRRAFFFADHSLLELIFPSLDRTQHSSKSSLISSDSLGARPYLIPKSSGGQEGSGPSISLAGGRIPSTCPILQPKHAFPAVEGCLRSRVRSSPFFKSRSMDGTSSKNITSRRPLNFPTFAEP